MSSKAKKTSSKAPLRIKDLRPRKNPKGGGTLKTGKPDMMDAQKTDLMDSTL
jgi:hypothetical protein